MFNKLMAGDVIPTSNNYGDGIHQYATKLEESIVLILMNYENMPLEINTPNDVLKVMVLINMKIGIFFSSE